MMEMECSVVQLWSVGGASRTSRKFDSIYARRACDVFSKPVTFIQPLGEKIQDHGDDAYTMHGWLIQKICLDIHSVWHFGACAASVVWYMPLVSVERRLTFWCLCWRHPILRCAFCHLLLLNCALWYLKSWMDFWRTGCFSTYILYSSTD
jgi:hypothetical protein